MSKRKRRRLRKYKRLLRQDLERWEEEKRKGREWRMVKHAEVRETVDALLDDIIQHPRKYLSRIKSRKSRKV
jgi:hypothetical protein